MDDAAWFNTAADDPPIVLGLRLHPLQFGHLLLLHKIESKFFIDPDAVTRSDLELAAIVCSQDWRESQKAIRKIANRSPMSRVFIRLWKWRVRKLKMGFERGKFDDYVSNCMWRPRTKRRLDTETEEAQSHWLYRMLAALMAELRLSFDDALSMQVAEGIRVHCAHAEISGNLKMVSDRDDELWKYAAEQDAKKFGGQN